MANFWFEQYRKGIMMAWKNLKNYKFELVMITVMGILLFGYWWKNYHAVLYWPKEKILSSPENMERFAEARINYVAENLPENVTHFYAHNRSVKIFLKEFLRAKILDEDLRTIKEGEKLAREGKSISLEMLPDMHMSCKETGREREAKVRQREIFQYVKLSPINFILAEGIDYEVNWKNFYHSIMKEYKNLGAPSIPFENFQKDFLSTVEGNTWWVGFLDEADKKIIGIDDERLARVILMFDDLGIKNVALLLNSYFREQLLLAKTIIEMRKYHVEHAIIVLGRMHVMTFPALGQKWGVKIEVKSLNGN